MKRKTAVIYLTIIVLLASLTIVSGYYAKGDWLKGQLGQLYPASPTIFTQHVVTRTKVKNPAATAKETATDNVVVEPVKICIPEADAPNAAIYCLRASPSKWNPSKDSIKFIYTLEGSLGTSIIHADVYDMYGQKFYSFPVRTNTKNNISYIDLWQGLDQKGFMIAPGKYYFAVYGEENNTEHILGISVDFEVI